MGTNLFCHFDSKEDTTLGLDWVDNKVAPKVLEVLQLTMSLQCAPFKIFQEA